MIICLSLIPEAVSFIQTTLSYTATWCCNSEHLILLNVFDIVVIASRSSTSCQNFQFLLSASIHTSCNPSSRPLETCLNSTMPALFLSNQTATMHLAQTPAFKSTVAFWGVSYSAGYSSDPSVVRFQAYCLESWSVWHSFDLMPPKWNVLVWMHVKPGSVKWRGRGKHNSWTVWEKTRPRDLAGRVRVSKVSSMTM